MTTKNIYRIFFTALALLAATEMNAQDTAHVLKNVDVKAQKLPESGKSVMPVQQLKKENLNTLNSLSVADAVKYFSGVLVKDYGGIGGLKTVSVRSLGANYTGVMYDGILLSDIQGGQIDLGKLSLDNIDEISLYNGQPSNNICQPARAYTTASMLMLKTGIPSFIAGEKIKLNAGIKTGSFGLVNPAATIHYKWNEKIFTSFNTEWQKSNGEYPFTFVNGDSVNKMKRINSDIDAKRIELDNRIVMNDSNKISIKAYYYRSERGLPGAVIIDNPNASQRLWDRVFFVQGNWEKRFTRSQLLVNAKYNYSFNRYLDPDYLNSNGKQENNYSQKEYYLSGAYAYDILSFLRLSYSADFIANTMNADLYNFAYPTRYTVLNNVVAQLKWQRFEIQANLLNTIVNDKVKTGIEPGNRNKFTPSVVASYQPFANVPVRVRTFYKDIFRMPTFNDLYYTNLGNTNLKPEYAKQYDIGVTWQQNFSSGILQAISFSTDGYYNKVTDKIVAVPRQNLFMWTMLNFGKVDIKGIDAGIQLFFKPVHQIHLFVKGNYTYQKTKDLSDPSSATYKDELPYTPKHSGSANFGLEYKAFTFNYNALFSGSRYRLGENIPYNELSSWNTQDISVAYRLHSKQNNTWKLTFELNNIFNQQYDIVKYYPMPGRSFRAGLNFQL